MNVNLPYKINWGALTNTIAITCIAFVTSAVTTHINGKPIIYYDNKTEQTSLEEGSPEFYDNNEETEE